MERWLKPTAEPLAHCILADVAMQYKYGILRDRGAGLGRDRGFL